MCIRISRTLSVGPAWYRLTSPRISCTTASWPWTPQLHLLSAPVAGHQACSKEQSKACWRLPGALSQQGGPAAWSWGMQYNLLDLSEWLQIEKHATALCESHASNMALALVFSRAPCLDAHPCKMVTCNCFTLPQTDTMQSSGKGWKF